MTVISKDDHPVRLSSRLCPGFTVQSRHVSDEFATYERGHLHIQKVSYATDDVTSDSRSQLPDRVHIDSSITIINGYLITVERVILFPIIWSDSNELVSLTGEKKWAKKFPPMPTKREHTTALCTS